MSKPDPTLNVEDLILKCVPGGDTCDPQKVADAIREYAAAVPALVQPEPFIAALRAYADNEYCLGIRMASGHDECLGWEHKLKVGKFGRAEMEAHKKMNRHLGAHFGIHEAIKRTLAASPSASQPEPSDARLEALIEDSDGSWHEDVFHIGGPELMALLRRAASASLTPPAPEASEGGQQQ